MDQPQSQDERVLDELAASVPLADPVVVSLVQELTAEISRLRAATDSSAGPGSATIESLTTLLLNQATELQQLRDRLLRVRALVELSAWAAGGPVEATDPTVRASDILHAIDGPIADRTS